MTTGKSPELRREIDVYPIGSMYGIFTYVGLICMVNVGKFTSPMDPVGYVNLPNIGSDDHHLFCISGPRAL